VVEEVAAGLDRLSKAELIALVTKMVDRHPDLEQLLELSVLSAGAESQPLDPALVERQVDAVFNNSDYEYGSEVDVAEQLADIKALGDDYAEREEWRNAALVYKTVIEGVLEHYGMFHDEGGELGEIVNECVSALEPCLAGAQEPDLRELILRTLFDTYHWNVDFGGIDMGYEAADLILAFATPAEKRKVVEWVRNVMPSGDSWSDNYHRQSYGHFMLRLQEDELDDETFLRICRETGRLYDLVERLLALNRVEEALQVAQDVSDYELLGMETAFSEYDQFDLFARLVAGRAPSTKDSRVKEWLKQYAEIQGNIDQALILAQELFWMHPSLEGYGQVKRLAAQLGRWPALQREIIDRLRQEPRYHDLLTRIYLQEGEIDQALEMVRQGASRPGWPGGYFVSTMALEVARAAEKPRPQAAIDIYQKQIERLINERNRGSYASAADLLHRMRSLYQRIDQEAAWRKLVAATRDNNPRLRALHDEMDKAGLP
jgi:tetratricopeptide (TPR) repeat protein